MRSIVRRAQLQDLLATEEPWCTFIDTRRSKATRKDYLYRLAEFREWLEVQGLELLTVKPTDLLRYISHLRTTNSSASILHHVYVLRSM